MSATFGHLTIPDAPPFAAGAVIRDVTGERYEVIAPLRGHIDGHGPHWAALRHVETGRRYIVSLQPLGTFTREVAP